MLPTVAILSFEGPDRYSLVGGLGTRVTELAQAFADEGRTADPISSATPAAGGRGRLRRLRYRRWCQWISAYHPGGVYDGESGKVDDFAASVPQFVADEIVARRPRRERGARAVRGVAHRAGRDRARRPAAGARPARRATLLWNANNTYGFEASTGPP